MDSFIQVSGLEFLALKKEQGPLLPNLSSLTARLLAPSSNCLSQGLRWTTYLLSKSLATLQVVGPRKSKFHDNYLLAGFHVLAALAKACSSIQTLFLFPFASDNQNHGVDPILSSILYDPLIQPFTALRNLRELGMSTIIAQPETFAVLGELPQLKLLALCATVTGPPVMPFDLPIHAFPALEHLTLNGLRNAETTMLLGLVTLVRNISTLEVVTTVGPNGKDWILDEFFPCLGHTHRLANLSVTFDEGWIMQVLPDIDATALIVLSKLPLLTFSLNGVGFHEDDDLSAVLRSLTKLDISSQYVDLGHLIGLATIPQLEHLVLSFDLDDEEVVPLEDDHPTCQSLHTIEILNLKSVEWRPRWVHETAQYVLAFIGFLELAPDSSRTRRFLLALFPNITQVVRSSKVDSETYEVNDLRWLNSEIAMQRRINELRFHITAKYGPDEAGLLIPASFLAALYE